MAVLDPKKLLPSTKKESQKASSINATRFLVPAKNIQYKPSAIIPVSPEDKKQGTTGNDINKDVLIIKEKVLSIEDILRKSLDLQKKKNEDVRKKLENKGRAKKEGALESFKNKKQINAPNILPKFGIFDAIKDFITNTFLGFIFYRLVKYLPQILQFAKNLAPAIDFIESFVGGMADKLITFIDFGYKVYDKVRDITKKIGGEKFQKTFDDFSGKLNTFINLALIAGMSTMGGTDFGLSKKPKGKPGAPGKPSGTSTRASDNLSRYLNRGKEAKLVERKFGNSAAKYYEELRASGKNSAEAFKEVKRKFQPRGLFDRRSVSGLAGEGQTAGQIGRRGLGRTATRTAARTFGKGGARVVKGASKALGRFPIIGPLIDFSFRYFVLREPLGKSAAGAVGAAAGQALGSWIGGSIGGVAGSVVPILGTLIGASAGAAIGGLLGGLIGDQLGVSLYDTITAYQKPERVQGRAGGGQITRGGRPTGGPSIRTLKVQRKTPKPPKLQAPKVNPGKDLGGKKVLEKIFNPEDKTKPNQISSFRALSKISGVLKGTNSNFFSQIAGVGVDLAMGQKPTRNFVARFGAALGSVFQELIDTNAEMTASETARSILAMANGGMVPESMVTRGGNFGKKVGESISNMFQNFIDNQSNLIISLLKQESQKDPVVGPSTQTGDGIVSQDGELAEGTVAKGQISIEQLVGLAKGAGFSQSDAVIMAAIAMAESGGNSNAHNNNRATGDNSYGLWQINMIDALGPERLKQFGISNNEQLKDPVVNAHAAKITKQSQGFAAWSVYKSGKYRAHLAAAQAAASSPAITVYKPGTGGGISGANVPLGSQSGSLQAVKALAESLGVPLFSSFRPGSRGYHGQGRAMDFSNDSRGLGTPQQLALAKEIIKRYGSSVAELIYTPLGFGIANGKRVPLTYWGPPSKSKWAGGDPNNTNAAHYDHVHVAFKRGGYTGSGGVGRLHGNEMIMNSNAVNLFGRNTFEAMNAMGDKLKNLPSAKISTTKRVKIPNSINQQASYEESGYTIIMMPIEKKVTVPVMGGDSGSMFSMGSNFSGNIDNSIQAALA